MRHRKRGYIPGAHYYSVKYQRMRNQRISESMKAYWFKRKAYEAYAKGTATPEQLAFVKSEEKIATVIGIVILIVFLLLLIGTNMTNQQPVRNRTMTAMALCRSQKNGLLNEFGCQKVS